MKVKIKHNYSRFTDKGPSIAERVIRTIGSLIKKPVFVEGNADWISELPSVIKHFNKTIHHSIKMTLVQASGKVNEKIIFSKLQDKKKQRPKFKLMYLVRTLDNFVFLRFAFVFSKGDSTNYSYKLDTLKRVIHDVVLG